MARGDIGAGADRNEQGANSGRSKPESNLFIVCVRINGHGSAVY